MKAAPLVLVAWATLVSAAHADWSVGIEPRTGFRVLDAHLSDFRWDVGARPFAGADLTLRNERWSLSVGASRSATEQATGLGDVTATTVTLFEAGITLRATVLRHGPVRLELGAGGGRLRSSWAPEVLRTDVDGVPIDVRFDPVGTWTRSLDARVSVRLRPALMLGLSAVARRFELDTAHRSGSTIVESEESFRSVDIGLFVRVVGWSSSNPETSS